MVTLTQEAKDKLRTLIAAEPAEGAGLRVQVVPGGCSGFEYDLSLTAPAEGRRGGPRPRLLGPLFRPPLPPRGAELEGRRGPGGRFFLKKPPRPAPPRGREKRPA